MVTTDKDINLAGKEVIVMDGTVRDGLAFYQQESLGHPAEWIFVIVHSDEDAQPTGLLQALRYDSEEPVREMIQGRPPNGLYAVFRNGKVVDTSDRFFLQPQPH